MSERQTQIVEAAIHLILKDGIGVSTAAIAKAAGVSNGTLFNAFATKQELIDAIYLTTKTGFYACLPNAFGAAFNRQAVRANWQGYLQWASEKPHHHRIMHQLLEAGLVSDAMRQHVEAMGIDHGRWIEAALADGTIRAPSLEFVGRLIFFHLDLVIDLQLSGTDEATAFDMLCKSIGLDT